MKKGTILALVILVAGNSVAYADCASSLNEGNSRVIDGNKYTKASNDYLAEMQKLIQEKAPNTQICAAGTDTRMAAYLATVAFKVSRAAFLNAINECSSPNDAVAAKNADVSTASYNGNANLIAKLDNILGVQCGAKPLTPIVNGN
jgi:hypothetical protein